MGRFDLIGLAQILFLGLQLTGAVSWNWIWVLSPVWAGLPLIALADLLLGPDSLFRFSLFWLVNRRRERKRKNL